MRDLIEIENNPRIKVIKKADGYMAGDISLKGVKCSLVLDWNDVHEHVSVAPYNQTIPTWEMMCVLKDTIFREEEEAYQFHPPKSEYVNIKKNCMHIWRRSDGKRLFEQKG